MFTTNWYGPTRNAAEEHAAQQVNESYWSDDGPVPTTAEPFRPGWFEAAPPERRVRLENHVQLWAALAAERLGQGEVGGRASL